ncbi:MAG: glycosyltransferase family 39 protein [Thermoflexales bacterium]|nr:glycosyltransferase family 39 protein [Thermoflexales bacterium]
MAIKHKIDWLPVGVLLLAFALRAYRLGEQNIWWDEGYSVYVARHSLGALTTVAAGDTHPPLYYWLLHLWMIPAGQSEFALRFPSLTFGVLTVALVYRLAAFAGCRPAVWIASLAALLLAVSRFHVWWSQEIRMYSLAAMWTAVNCQLLIVNSLMVNGQERRRSLVVGRWSLYALSLAAGMYSLYLFVFVAAAQALYVAWLAWRQWREGRCWPASSLLAGWGGAAVAAGLLLLPWLAYTLPRLKSWSAASEFGPLTYLQVAWTALTLGLTEHVEQYWALNLAFACILIAGAVLPLTLTLSPQGRGTHYVLRITYYVLLVPILGVFFLLTLPHGLAYRPPLEARYQLLNAPALALALALSIAALWRWRKAAGLLAGLFVVGALAWTLPSYYQGRHLRDDFQTMTAAIEAYAEPGDALLLVSGDRFPLFNFRYDALPHRAELPGVTTLPVRRVTGADVESWLVPLAQAHERVWLAEVEKNLQDPDGLLSSWLDEHRHVAWREEYGYNRLTLYSAGEGPLVVPDRFGRYPLWAEVGDALFWGYDLPVRKLQPGDVGRWVAYFKVGAPFTLTIGLQDARGHVLEARDYWLEPGRGVARVRFDVPVYARTPPGAYHFTLSPLHSRPPAMPLYIVSSPPIETVPSIPNPLEARVGESIRLLGYQAPAAARPGDDLPVTLYWQTPAKLAERYTVFVHLVGSAFNPRTGGPLWAGHDGEPLDGGYPTTQWFVDVPLADTHVLAVPSDAPPGEYELWAGLYTQPDVKRLPVYDEQGRPAGDHIVLGRLRIQ